MSQAAAYPWFAVARSILTSWKIQTLSGDHVRAWLNLLCVADNDGILPDTSTPQKQWELKARIPTVPDILDIIEIFKGQDRQLIDVLPDGRLRMHDWEDHQPGFRAREQNRLKQQRFRERHKSSSAQPPLPEIAPEVEPAPETPVEDDTVTITLRNPLDTEVEKEKEEIPPYNPPLAVAVDPRKPLQQRHVPGEWEERWHQFHAAYPGEYAGDVSAGAQSFLSLIGLKAPSADGLIVQNTGIPDTAYFDGVVLPSLKAACTSKQWAPDKDGKRFIPSMRTFLVGGGGRDFPRFGRMWLTKWTPLAPTKVRPEPSSDGLNPNADYISPWEADRRKKLALLRRGAA